MGKLIVAVTFLMGSIFGFSQEVVKEQTPYSVGTLKQADELPTEGTYQIILRNKDIVATIADETLFQVNYKREVENETYLIIDENIKIRILPFNVIRANDFMPLTKYSYEN